MKATLKASFGLVAAVVTLFSLIATFVANRTSKLMVSEAERTVHSVVKATTGRIDQLMFGVETAVTNSAWVVGEHLNEPDYMYRITRELVENNQYIVGSTVAFRPDYYADKGFYFAPYTCIGTNGQLVSFQLGTPSNDIYRQSWYCDTVKAGTATWCEPYFDEGGGRIYMSTYSLPLKDASNDTYAVFTADLSLEQLREHVASLTPYENSYAVMKSAQGALLVAPPPGHENNRDGTTITICDQADNGWTVEITCPIENILRGSQKMVMHIIVFSLTGLVMIFSVAWFFASRLQRAAALRERIEGELSTARDIQLNLLPRVFPSGIAASLRPAREVGGDLYDFAESRDRLYFIVGDASGKGVPAALFSFMAVTVFRMAAAMELKAHEIVERINAALVRGNDMCMFVTALVGVLDRKTGELEYCSAGHNPPVVLGPDGVAAFLPVKRNLPTGAVSDRRYETQRTTLAHGTKLFVYTDGITEAMNECGAQFGEARLLECLRGRGDTDIRQLTETTLGAVGRFVGAAEQSDDITILGITVD